MNTSELFLASMMLCAPAGAQESIHESDWPRVSVALRRVATEWELLDEREHKYFFVEYWVYQNDIDIVRKRKGKLEGAPTLAELRWLPPSFEAAKRIDFNKEYAKHLQKRMAWELDRVGLLTQVLEENERLGRIWDCVRSAASDQEYVWNRRCSGMLLLEYLAKQGYDRHELPPSVPLWAFSPLR